MPSRQRCALIEPVDPNSGKGRSPVGPERMLRIYCLLSRGTILDATIIHAPRSTKNAAQARDREMHQTKKGNQWYFGTKAHIRLDCRSKLIHSVVVAATVADATLLPALLRGDDRTHAVRSGVG
ncbi:MAG: transposase [Rhodospirillales bacterium]|nr:transposase [Rhodospirillales bacterium]